MSKILVCNPSFYSLEYEINPWMDTNNKPDQLVSEKQWNLLHDTLSRCGAELVYINSEPEVPDMVFVANAGVVRGNTVVLSNFKHPERQKEKQYYKDWFLKNNYKVIEIPEHLKFEGAGDALFFNDILFMGYGFRTDLASHKLVATALNVDYISCELVDPRFYHLDTCFLPTKNRVVYHRKAFSISSVNEMLDALLNESQRMKEYLDVVNVCEGLAKQFVCNSVCIGENVITPSKDCASVFYDNMINYCDMSEFIKAGGAVKCLTLQL